MLSASTLSQGVRTVAAMLSPEKNPCRVRMADSCDNVSNWYRFDPYVSKVLASPLKTQMSPKTQIQPEAGLHRNSLFNAPKPMVVTPPAPVFEQAQSPPASAFIQKAKAPEVKAPAKTHYAVVYFKHDSATYVAPFRVKEGDHVIVEGDRGVDLGVISQITTETPKYRVPLKIVRRATSKDMEAFESKQLKERVITEQVQQLAESLSLGISVVDTEFQFDNNKLTVFFDTHSNNHVDFRKLQRGLFREHRCRIWLSNMAEVEYNAKLQLTRRTR